MKTLRRPIVSAAAVMLAAAALAAGCGAGDVIDSAKTEIAVRYDVEEATGTGVKAVVCPTDVPAAPGTRFTCRVEAKNGDLAVAELEVQTTRGDLRVIRLRKP